LTDRERQRQRRDAMEEEARERGIERGRGSPPPIAWGQGAL